MKNHLKIFHWMRNMDNAGFVCYDVFGTDYMLSVFI